MQAVVNEHLAFLLTLLNGNEFCGARRSCGGLIPKPIRRLPEGFPRMAGAGRRAVQQSRRERLPSLFRFPGRRPQPQLTLNNKSVRRHVWCTMIDR